MSAGKSQNFDEWHFIIFLSFRSPAGYQPLQMETWPSLLSEPLISQQSSGYNVRHVLSV